MLQLVLFRHAEAARPEGVADVERPLSPRGRADARAMGQLFAEQGSPPDLVVISPALRTRETWDIAGAGIAAVPVRIEPQIYETTAESVLTAILRNLDPSARHVMLVGHNPWIEDLAWLLVGAEERQGGSPLRNGLPTAAIAILDLAATSWPELAPEEGRLQRFLAPER